MHIEEAGKDEKEEDVNMWWESEEEEYVEEEEKDAFEPEPEEWSKLAAEKGWQFRVFDPGGRKVVYMCEWECFSSFWSDCEQWCSI